MRFSLAPALLALSAILPLASNAANADYLIVIPATKSAPPSLTIDMALTGGVLPDALREQPYSESMHRFLRVTGDPSYQPADVTWTLASGSLPLGLTLRNGVITGTPTQFSDTSFEVLATYKDKEGKEVYSIKVGGTTLEATAISMGANHSCAITPSTGVKCWGNGFGGMLGNQSNSNSQYPVNVRNLTGVTAISLGGSHSCAIASGEVYCWGMGGNGSLGHGFKANSTIPVKAINLSNNVTAVSAGSTHTCAIDSGTVKCWGDLSDGKLGVHLSGAQLSPIEVAGLSNKVTAISAGYAHTCAIDNGAAKCWGSGKYGNLGNLSETYSVTPVQVDGLTSGVTGISAGNNTSCAIVNGGLKCWGYGYHGQLGNNSTNNALGPVDAVGLSSGVSSVSVGSSSACALVSGVAKCWGYNNSGQVGAGLTDSKLLTPTNVVGLVDNVTSIESGGSHACALLDTGNVSCWGLNNNGQRGDTDTATTRKAGSPIQF